MRAGLVVLELVTGVVVLASCSSSTSSYGTGGGGGGGGTCTPTATKICVANYLFNPASMTVTSGTTVTWQNVDAASHTATSNPSNPAGCPAWDQSLSSGASGSAVLTATSTPVTCQYYCRNHATPTTGAMRASVTIQ